jgi:hypothetical protein
MTTSEPYRDTSVPVERSKQQIRDALKRAGARGMQLEETWDSDGRIETCLVRFIWIPEESVTPVKVRLEATPLAPEKRTDYRGGWKVSPEQRERQAWRGLSWYLESLVKAATFGIVPFEAVFLAYFEDAQGKTIGEHVIPMLEEGKLALPAIGGTG